MPRGRYEALEPPLCTSHLTSPAFCQPRQAAGSAQKWGDTDSTSRWQETRVMLPGQGEGRYHTTQRSTYRQWTATAGVLLESDIIFVLDTQNQPVDSCVRVSGCLRDKPWPICGVSSCPAGLPRRLSTGSNGSSGERPDYKCSRCLPSSRDRTWRRRKGADCSSAVSPWEGRDWKLGLWPPAQALSPTAASLQTPHQIYAFETVSDNRKVS